MDDILQMSDRLWRGEAEIAELHPLETNGGLYEVAEDTAYVATFARVSCFSTGEGLVLVDSGHELVARQLHSSVRGWRTDDVKAAVFSHGHVDHVFGLGPFEEEAAAAGRPGPRVYAHEALPARFDRYKMTAGYNAVVNARQFQLPGLTWPTEYRYPDEVYSDQTSFEVGGALFELHHAKGETDDHTWTYLPGRRVLCPGDLFIWCSPNAGNPQKVQRYPLEWAEALRQMAALEAEVMLPGHGFPLVGAERIRQALSETAELLESLVAQSLELMNAGARLDELIHQVTPPPHLLERPYLRPVYDEPEFIVRNIWRLYGGWYDGNPATLQPAPEATLASELASLAGGVEALAARALELLAANELRLAAHLAETATLAAPRDPAAHRARAAVFSARAAAASSTMAKGIYAWAARQSAELAGEEP